METLPTTHTIAPPMSQNEAVLLRLLNAKGQYVAMPELSDYTAVRCDSRSMNIHSRVAELRAKGWKIENRVETTKSGRRISMYRLITEALTKTDQ
jgi:hypothetical protein